ncbi:Metacaspase-1 [Gracilariopsis chorda]|uniref:Metacaspase-1 n=1 Tax=Gracilariopsis chorda TaxID=448386 RepID=A0A2V3J1I8_9FLOR|nr:Metacaspase-1 [Gracilariopsis chorda]|eukprot:PXF47827.1 Metacaspase-1 [Gracilariopsis chorda]
MKLGFPKESIWLLTDESTTVAGAIRLTPTRANIINAIKWLVLNAKRGDKLIFAFCGHGAQVRKDDSNSPRRVLQCILPSDYPVGSPITGTNLFTLLASSLNMGAYMTLIFDCGFSDRIMCLPYLYSVKRGHKGKLVVGEGMHDNEKISLYDRSSPFSTIMKHTRQQKEYTQLKKQIMEEQRDELAASLFEKGTVVCLSNGTENPNRLFSLSPAAYEYGSLSSAFVSVMHDVYSQNSSITFAKLLTDMSALLVKKRGTVLPELRSSHKVNIQSQVVNL